ncbi:MAG: ABC transporter permease [Planctomycetota bacterium]
MTGVTGPGLGRSGWIGLGLLLAIGLPCFLLLPWSAQEAFYNNQRLEPAFQLQGPSWSEPFGTDALGRSLLWRCLLGGAISLGIGLAAAGVAVVIGVLWGALSGYAGGRTDAVMMRAVDVLYGLPYILLVVLIGVALQPTLEQWLAALLPAGAAGTATLLANLLTLFVAISAVSWLTMSRVVRGQVLSLRNQPFVESARAIGAGPGRVLRVHLLPNLVGVIVVYMTLTVPLAILQESFLSFLGIGVQPPLPSWGNLASEGVKELPAMAVPSLPMRWWLLVMPCVLLGLTLLAMNFLGDALRRHYDPRKGG